MESVQEKSKTHSTYDTLSRASIYSYRSEAFAQIRYLADRLATIGNAVEQLDAALMTTSTDMSASEQQALITAGRDLVAVLGGLR